MSQALRSSSMAALLEPRSARRSIEWQRANDAEHWEIEGTQMQETYRAVEVSEPGVLRVVERPMSEPGPGQVRIRVEACGICHTDAATVTGTYPGLKLPRVPGHEVVGRIDALGSG